MENVHTRDDDIDMTISNLGGIGGSAFTLNGADAARFLAHYAPLIEDPRRLL